MQRLAGQRRRTDMFSFILANLFPVDFSSFLARFVFRLPSIYLLGKTLLLWSVVLLQTLHRFPAWQWGWLQAVDRWTSQKSMEEICWFTFVSVCTTLFISALTSGMDDNGSNNNTPFNLVSTLFY